jgi:hypothetical protein
MARLANRAVASGLTAWRGGLEPNEAPAIAVWQALPLLEDYEFSRPANFMLPIKLVE